MFNIIQKKRQLYFFLFTIVYVGMSVVCVELVTSLFIQNQVDSEKDEIRYQVALIRSRIEANIYRDAYLVESVSTLVTMAPDFAVKNWSEIAERLFARTYYVRNLALYPNDVITHIYPTKGNEKVLGLDLRTLNDQYHTVLKARRYQTVYLTNPIDLVQGGKGIVARYPIFSDFPYKQDYWGGVSIVIDYEKMLQQSGALSVKGAELAFVSNLYGERDYTVIMGEESTVTNSDFSFPVHLPSGSWTIHAHFTSMSTSDYQLAIILRLSGFFTFLSFYILLYHLHRHYHHTKDVSLQDELTGLPNRRFMLEVLDNLMDQVKHAEHSPCFAVLNIDLNKFKRINDTFGHLAGDEMLRHIAHVFVESLRSSDVVCRVGGDEFVVLLHRISTEKEVETVIHQLNNAVNETVLIWDGNEIYPSVSIGYALYDKAKDKKVDSILARADRHMYKVKMAKKGRDVTTR